jgi:hypothetical protein
MSLETKETGSLGADTWTQVLTYQICHLPSQCPRLMAIYLGAKYLPKTPFVDDAASESILAACILAVPARPSPTLS